MEQLNLESDVVDVLGEEPEEEEQEPFAICAKCNDPIETEDDSKQVRVCNRSNIETWCTSCANDDARTNDNGDYYENDTYYEYYFRCEGCNEEYSQDYYSGDGYCESCYEPEDDEEQEDENGLAQYSTRAENVHGFFGVTRYDWNGEVTGHRVHNRTLFFGMELEVECLGERSDFEAATDRIKYLLDGFAILKSDGSLSDKGFEIVTAPATMKEFRRKTKQFFAELPELCQKYQLRSWHTTTCGLHVHISRNALSELQIGKIQSMITDQSSYAMVRKIAGRNATRWSGYSDKKKIKDRPGEMGHGIERYTAVNLCNHETVEFRLFKGTTSEAGIFRDLEFALSLAEFTAPGAGMSLRHANESEAYGQWLSLPEQRKTYPNLTRFLSERAMISGHNRHGLVKGVQ